MDTITFDNLKHYYPLTYKTVMEQKKYFLNPLEVNIRIFLERNGYSISVVNVIDSEKYVPSVVYHGNEVGNTRQWRTNPNDFEHVSMDKAKEFGLTHALKDFEDHCTK